MVWLIVSGVVLLLFIIIIMIVISTVGSSRQDPRAEVARCSVCGKMSGSANPSSYQIDGPYVKGRLGKCNRCGVYFCAMCLTDMGCMLPHMRCPKCGTRITETV